MQGHEAKHLEETQEAGYLRNSNVHIHASTNKKSCIAVLGILKQRCWERSSMHREVMIFQNDAWSKNYKLNAACAPVYCLNAQKQLLLGFIDQLQLPTLFSNYMFSVSAKRRYSMPEGTCKFQGSHEKI